MIKPAYLFGVFLFLGAGPAFAQQASSTEQATSPATDGNFMTGLRRVGVLAGRSVVCAPEATRPQEISKVAAAGNQIAMEFGMRAAFNFVGAAGYGSGDPFDKASCADTMKQWTAVQQSYGEK